MKMESRVSYWKLRETLAKTSHERIHMVHRQKGLRIKDTCTTDISYINAKLRTAWEDLYQAQRTVGQLRTTHLEDLAAHKAETKGTTAAAEIKKLLHIEQVRKTAKKYGWYLKEKRKGMITIFFSPPPTSQKRPPSYSFSWLQLRYR